MPGGGFQDDVGDRFDHRDHPGLEQCGGDAHGIAARHRGVFSGFGNDVTELGFGVGGGHDVVDTVVDCAAGFVQQQLAQVVAVFAEVLHLLEDGRAGCVADAAGDHVVHFAADVALDHIDHSTPAHWRSFRFCFGGVGPEAVTVMMRQCRRPSVGPRTTQQAGSGGSLPACAWSWSACGPAGCVDRVRRSSDRSRRSAWSVRPACRQTAVRRARARHRG